VRNEWLEWFCRTALLQRHRDRGIQDRHPRR
jgi:hypothetical protein